MKKSLLFILILFGALSLHAQNHKHYKDTIDVVMESVFVQPILLDTTTCPCNLTLTLGPATGGGGGPITYLWQQSKDNVTWSNAEGTNTGQNYAISGLLSNMYYRRLAATAACGTIIGNSALVTFDRPPLPKFMAYNLGADSTLNTPALQMEYLADDAYGLNATGISHGRVFGGRYQWGRQNLPYAIDPSTYLLYDGAGTAIPWTSSMTYDANGQLVGQDNYYVYNTSTPYDWRGTGTATAANVSGQWNALWGNGQHITTPTPGTGAVLHTDGNYYQRPDKTVNDPCPSGFRLPTQNDWELMCNYYDCDPTDMNGRVDNSGVGKTYSGLTWVQVRCSGGTCKMATLAANVRGGYAVYRTSDWESAGYTAANDLITATIQPLLFLPAAGYRQFNNGRVYDMGRIGHYWSSSFAGGGSSAISVRFVSNSVEPDRHNDRANGFSIRCVKCGAEPCP